MILAVPTNIITGFLGVGKTSAIKHLLSLKPTNERWAVLVNEFGEIGIDQSLLAGQTAKAKGIFIREVPGGCMCCAASLPMQIALNQLLAASRPHRLLIEPTGLGHPKEVMQVLTSEHYRPVLSIDKTITLVDARKLTDSRYTDHETFKQQLAIADVVVGNKQDRYCSADKPRLKAYVQERCRPSTSLTFTQHGQISLESLAGPAKNYLTPDSEHRHEHTHHHHAASEPLVSEQMLTPGGMLRAQNSGEGYHTEGWRFAPDIVFNYKKLRGLLNQISAERMKGIFITDAGVFGYNLTTDGLTEMVLDECTESRVEIIADHLPGDLDTQLKACFE
ncbi:MAG: GTP-binding protein [Alteromonadaceae bacterium]|nr:GTP-binding protein [Alteromonadaceae bacterium]